MATRRRRREMKAGWKRAIVPILSFFAASDRRPKQGKTHIRNCCKWVTFAPQVQQHTQGALLAMRTSFRLRTPLAAVPASPCFAPLTTRFIALLGALLAPFIAVVAWSQPLPTGKPETKSATVLVVDESDGTVLYAKQSKKVMPVASITKLMTALVVLEGKQPLDEELTILPADRERTKASASRLAVGTKLTRGELLHLALMSSENRAAQAVARAYPGGLSVFIKRMNAKARELGMKNTRFADPTGLSPENVSTAVDLVKLVSAASREPLIQQYSTSEQLTVQVGRQMLEFRNTNSLTSKDDWDISVQKTGYTQLAGQCLVMKATIQDRPIVMVLLNSFGKLTRVADARRIRRWMEHGTDTQLARAGK
jgi:D-alanyl-D-alanine endopeptidase (penicillin-binding protein 7)